MEEPSGDKAGVGGMSALLAPPCLPKHSLGENALHSMISSHHAGYWAADPCCGEKFGLSMAWRAGH